MKKFVLLIVCIVLSLQFGCSTTSELIVLDETVTVKGNALFTVGNVTDASGFVFSKGDSSIVLGDAMHDAMVEALEDVALQGREGDYLINTKIVRYAPGNAAVRWLMPGAGATRLTTVSEVLTSEGVVVARIPVERRIAFGGAFTIGAWKTVFKEVAKETVGVLMKKLLAKQG